MAYLLTFLIIGVAMTGFATLAFWAWEDIRDDRRRQKAYEAEQAAKCEHVWGPWGEPYDGHQDRYCNICNKLETTLDR